MINALFVKRQASLDNYPYDTIAALYGKFQDHPPMDDKWYVDCDTGKLYDPEDNVAAKVEKHVTRRGQYFVFCGNYIGEPYEDILRYHIEDYDHVRDHHETWDLYVVEAFPQLIVDNKTFDLKHMIASVHGIEVRDGNQDDKNYLHQVAREVEDEVTKKVMKALGAEQ